MPEIKQIHKFIAANDNIEMLTVSMDDISTAQDLRDTIRESRIKYPVLHINAGDGWNDGAFDWHITGVPSAFIIDPMGNIFADVYPQESLVEVFEWLGSQDTQVPLTGVSADYQLQDDGSILVQVQMSSPTHAPLDVDVSVTKFMHVYNPEYDTEGTGEPNTFDNVELDGLELSFTQDFEMFGEAAYSFVIPAQPGATYVSFEVGTNVPGMEALNGGEGFSVGANKFVLVNQDKD